MKKLRIFISSPGDVAHERRIAKGILKRLRGEFEGRLEVEPYFWEHEPYEVSKGYQEQIPSPQEFDLMVCFLWGRLGSRLHESLTLPDGRPAGSGTEYEVEWALEGFRQSGAPEAYVWLNKTEPVFPVKPKEKRDADPACRNGRYCFGPSRPGRSS